MNTHELRLRECAWFDDVKPHRQMPENDWVAIRGIGREEGWEDVNRIQGLGKGRNKVKMNVEHEAMG